MDEHKTSPEDLLTFPCDHIFKAFGPSDEAFVEAVKQAVGTVLAFPVDAVRIRSSGKGSYVCVSVLVRLYNADQLRDVYARLQRINDLKYVL